MIRGINKQGYKKIGDSDNPPTEIVKIIGRITSIAKEICELTEYEVPTMKKS
ncbi:hypothetical protein SPSIL_039800 [Sporomusa silvacetica DSM 10669]|uniref:Uncharacterized protein n=1 Tax=Sporomusa silvacetica DSM 10669 TaxID=1123289 RepID=A0ABZ3IQ10_9FIRM|nr:hypothetical protein [Sporomusa silvacetica]OZC16285.1 hypothetical protein SPSIL_38480 [Sporomusa silvacetica DSM 10669]